MIRTEGGNVDVESVYSSYRKAYEATKEWRKEATQCFAYLAGDQYDPEDLEALQEDRRPAIEFNQFAVYIETVCGLEQLQREEVNYSPRLPGYPTAGASDILNAAARYVTSDSDAGFQQSQAFQDMVTCGMGWTETRMDYTTNPDGDVVAADRLDPINEMYWDPRAKKRNLADARWVLRVRPMTRGEVEDRWPQKVDKISWGNRFQVPSDFGIDIDRRPQDEYKTYPGGREERVPEEHAEVHVGHVQWYEEEPYYRVLSPDGQQVEASKAEWRAFSKENPDLAAMADAVLMKKRVYKQAYIVGDTVLEEGPGPCGEDFTFQAMTGKFDRNNNTWYGLGRPMVSPQKWVNKMYSAFIETIATNAKGGGIMTEVGAHPNPRELADNWANPAYIPAFNPGALQSGKVLPKPMTPIPQGIDRLMEIAMGMFQHVSGVNPELLGLVAREQAGVLEYQRKQASMTTLSWAFIAMKQYRKRHGRVLAYFISKYISDGRLIRVSGREDAVYLPLTKDPGMMEYDIDVDTAPSSPNERDRVFSIIRELLPQMASFGIAPPPDVLDYLPLPTALVEKWKERISQPNPEQQAAQQLMMQRQQAEIDKIQSDAMLNQVKGQSESIKGQIEASRIELEKIRMTHETQMMQQKLWTEQMAQRQKQQAAEMDARLQEQKLVAEQQSQIMDMLKADMEQRHMREQFMVSQAERQKQSHLDMAQQVLKIKEEYTNAMADHIKSVRDMVAGMHGYVSEEKANSDVANAKEIAKKDIARVVAEHQRKIEELKRDQEEEDMKDKKILMDIINTMQDLAAKVDAISQQGSTQSAGQQAGPVLQGPSATEIVRDELGRIASVGNKRIIRDENGMVTGIEG